jgi:hypothetical protein
MLQQVMWELSSPHFIVEGTEHRRPFAALTFCADPAKTLRQR